MRNNYEEHARGIQAKLLTRLHADTNQRYKDSQTEKRQQEAIPVDEDDTTVQIADPPTMTPMAEPEQSSPSRVSRWTNVDHAEIMAGQSLHNNQEKETRPSIDSVWNS
jgi:hypothetical protein